LKPPLKLSKYYIIIFFEVPIYYTFINFTLIGTGCLGHGDWNSSAQPELVEALLSVHVTAVACGPEHVVVVGSQGDVYAWGRGSEGRLGLGHEEDTYLPQVHYKLTMATLICQKIKLKKTFWQN
jgi:hypothetical protein